MIDAIFIVALMLGAPSPQAPTVPSYTQVQAEQDLRSVIETFRTSIINKDKAAFLALFPDGPVIWQGVDSDALAAKAKRGEGIDAKIAINPGQTPRSFIEGIVGEQDRSEERFANVAINTDGDVASVTFDFVFLLNDRPINVGKESWHLVRSEKGWKIVSVIYSNNDPV